jgi:hypothetical protein
MYDNFPATGGIFSELGKVMALAEVNGWPAAYLANGLSNFMLCPAFTVKQER